MEVSFLNMYIQVPKFYWFPLAIFICTFVKKKWKEYEKLSTVETMSIWWALTIRNNSSLLTCSTDNTSGTFHFFSLRGRKSSVCADSLLSFLFSFHISTTKLLRIALAYPLHRIPCFHTWDCRKAVFSSPWPQWTQYLKCAQKVGRNFLTRGIT